MTSEVPFTELLVQAKEFVSTVEATPLSYQRRLQPIPALVSRFAPAKLVLRLLANRLSGSSTEWINLRGFSRVVVNVASTVKLQVDSLERANVVLKQKPLGLAVGFPQKTGKSEQRFSAFYIGRLRTDNRIEGLLGDLELAVINRSPSGDMIIGITELGLVWANHKSPLADDLIIGHQPIINTLADEEIDFLLKHIKHVRPGEYDYLKYLLEVISRGEDTPRKLSHLISDYFRDIAELSSASLRGILASGIARLMELRMIRIEREGIYSKYIADAKFARSFENEAHVSDHFLTEKGVEPKQKEVM